MRQMQENYQPIDEITCPNCGNDLCTDDNVMEICDGGMGAVIECPSCNHEIDFTLMVRVDDLNE